MVSWRPSRILPLHLEVFEELQGKQGLSPLLVDRKGPVAVITSCCRALWKERNKRVKADGEKRQEGCYGLPGALGGEGRGSEICCGWEFAISFVGSKPAIPYRPTEYLLCLFFGFFSPYLGTISPRSAKREKITCYLPLFVMLHSLWAMCPQSWPHSLVAAAGL